MSRFWLVAQSTFNVGPYYTSYDFNGGNFSYGPNQVPQWPGIAGCKLSSVQGPSKTVLIAEYPALIPFSWHEPVRCRLGRSTDRRSGKGMEYEQPFHNGTRKP